MEKPTDPRAAALVTLLAGYSNPAYNNCSAWEDAVGRVLASWPDLSPGAPIDETGDPWWVVARRSSNQDLKTPKWLALIRTHYGDAMFAGTHPSGEPVASRVLRQAWDDAWVPSSSREPSAAVQSLAWLVRHVPESALTVRDAPGGSKGSGVAGPLVGRAGALPVLQALGERGVTLNAEANGRSLAWSLNTVEGWNLFLSQGGDPTVCGGDPSDPTRPLWAFLLRAFEDRLAKPIRAWAAQAGEAGDTLLAQTEEALRLQEYWTAFAGVPRNRAAMLAHLTSRSDWVTQTDRDGVPAWVRAAFMVPSVLQPLMAAHADVLKRPDGSGRSSWLYVLQLTTEPHAPDWASLVRVFGPWEEAARDAAGQGLLLQALQAPRVKRASGRTSSAPLENWMPSRFDGFLSWAKGASPEVWVGGTAAQQDAAADRVWRRPLSPPVRSMIQAFRTCPDLLQAITPRLRGVLWLAALAQNPTGFGEAKRSGDCMPADLREWADAWELDFPSQAGEQLEIFLRTQHDRNRKMTGQTVGQGFEKPAFLAEVARRVSAQQIAAAAGPAPARRGVRL